MARTKLTDEEKLQRKLAKKAEKQALRDAEWKARQEVWAAQAKASRETQLAAMEPSRRQRFEKAVAYAAKSSNEFFKDLANKWERFGNMSDKQIDVLVNAVERDQKKEAISEVIEDWYEVDSKIETPALTIQNIKEVPVEMGYGLSGYTTKITMKHSSGIFFTVKTNAGKLIGAFNEANEQNKMVKLNAKVKWHFKDSDTVILTSRGMKVEIINV